MAAPHIVRDEFANLTLMDVQETRFFGRHEGQLCQWLTLTVKNHAILGYLTVEVHSGGRQVVTRMFIGPVGHPQPCRIHAPVRWPRPADHQARLIVRHGQRVIEAVITTGSYRPWSVYLLSDACVDDTWAYDDVARFDRDDYLTTAAEVAAHPDASGHVNCYNLPTNYQLDRFYRQATPAQRRLGAAAVREGRLYVSPVPNQLNCAAFNLTSYPLLLEPYRRLCAQIGLDNRLWQRDAYHMEAPTWSNGLANLLHCAGFDGLAKSILNYRSPWTKVLSKMPLASRLEVGPGRFMHLVLTCDAYSDGLDLLAGVESANALLHDRWMPQLETSRRLEGTTALPLFGMYCDLTKDTKTLVAVKQAVVAAYNAQGWEYPRLINAAWPQFFAHLRRDHGPADRPVRTRSVTTLRGDSGASWELWMSAVQTEHARFRRAQRDLVSLQCLDAIVDRPARGSQRAMEAAVADLVQLGDHAWNGSHDVGRALNLAIRRGRLKRIEERITRLRKALVPKRSAGDGGKLAVVNTLGWRRTCRVELEAGGSRLQASMGQPPHLHDPETGESFAFTMRGNIWTCWVPDIPGFGVRRLELRRLAGGRPVAPAGSAVAAAPLAASAMRPVCGIEGKPVKVTGRWNADGSHGKWRVAGFTLEADWRPSPIGEGAWELSVQVAGQPPSGSYELVWEMTLPWDRVRWRGETGGGFVTPGPADRGGDWLGGVGGSVFAAGDGLAAIGRRGCLAMAFEQTGMCRLADLDGSQPLRSLKTDGRMGWVLLGTGINPTEAVRDQAGDRAWRFCCTLRRGMGALSDVTLHQFATGCYRVGEIVDGARLPASRSKEPWLDVKSKSVIPLAVRRRGRQTEIDLYNTAEGRVLATVRGAALRRRQLSQTDMLGRMQRAMPDGRVSLAGRAFGRVVATLP